GGAKGGQEPARVDPRGLLAALPADHDDHVRRAVRRPADRARLRRRLRVAPAARHRHRRRADRVAVPHALYDAGDLSLSRSAGAPALAPPPPATPPPPPPPPRPPPPLT